MQRLGYASRGGYEVSVERDLLAPGAARIPEAIGGRRAFVVTTPTVAAQYAAPLHRLLSAAGVSHALCVLPLREHSKTLESVSVVAVRAREAGLGRRDVFVAFGGGVATDVVSVTASLYRRGIPVIRLPSSLIGQVDAGIGLKSAVNLGGVKSALGGFHAPEVVLSDPDWLRSLRPRALRAGMSEIVKMAIIRDPRLFDDVAAFGGTLIASRFTEAQDVADSVLCRAIELMLRELQANPFEEELARVVDFGHTFSPLLESVSGYRLNHGEAVAVDMAVSARIAACLGVLTAEELESVVGLLRELRLPVASTLVTPELLARAADDAVAHRGGSLNLVLPAGIGTPTFLRQRCELSDTLLREVAATTTARRPRRAAHPHGAVEQPA